MTRIFVDSDAFIALVKSDDSNHRAAVKYINNLKSSVSFVTSNYVFSEVVTVLSLRVGKPAAIDFIDTMRSPDAPYTILQVNEAIDQAAVAIFKDLTSKNVSFTDCVNMALVRANKFDAIFSFDKIYKKNAIVTVPK